MIHSFWLQEWTKYTFLFSKKSVRNFKKHPLHALIEHFLNWSHCSCVFNLFCERKTGCHLLCSLRRRYTAATSKSKMLYKKIANFNSKPHIVCMHYISRCICALINNYDEVASWIRVFSSLNVSKLVHWKLIQLDVLCTMQYCNLCIQSVLPMAQFMNTPILSSFIDFFFDRRRYSFKHLYIYIYNT